MNSRKLQDTQSTYKNQFGFCTLTTNNLRKKLRKAISFTFANDQTKYLKWISLKRLKICTLKTTKHYWMKTKEIQINGNTSCVHGLEELNIVECPCYPKVIYIFNATLTKIPRAYINRKRKNNSKILWSHKGHR